MSAPALDAAPDGQDRFSERFRLGSILTAIVLLHGGGIVFHLLGRGDLVAAGGLSGAGILAYVLGVRHAFDADHLAAIDDTTRLMLVRGRRPVGVGFFFAMGHSSVVVVLALLVWWGAGSISSDRVMEAGGTVAAIVAAVFLLLVAGLNTSVLRGLLRLWRRARTAGVDRAGLEDQLANRGLVMRLFGGRARALIRSSWHMYPIGLLMGLGLETASEVALLALAASAYEVSLLGVISLPLLFAAGMTTFDTADSLIMAKVYSWSYRDPARTLFFNLVTTSMTVLVAFFVAAVYISGLGVEFAGASVLAPVAAVANHFEFLGLAIAGIFLATWLGALLLWRGSVRHRAVE
ncbi:HoxN/HupN/NixA family nickel/cobalt transporter [Arthrobacter zhaoguopingii]|uniref:HoxN/HupN/NixA family nickel/cobalt transporter n=1 Tax=Arthrobacter zhaoguopingii TaxID=2681491 RepID=UPI00135C7A97|nr:HoxN/HupN/NixA family nickel/cobalt transporter [Arthrobacter zhaoguopingii]